MCGTNPQNYLHNIHNTNLRSTILGSYSPQNNSTILGSKLSIVLNWSEPQFLKFSELPDKKVIYVIFKRDPKLNVFRTIRIGQGLKRNLDHKNNYEIMKHDTDKNPLFITFAYVNPSQLNGIERYLGIKLRPIEGEKFPINRAIPVQIPYEIKPGKLTPLEYAILS